MNVECRAAFSYLSIIPSETAEGSPDCVTSC